MLRAAALHAPAIAALRRLLLAHNLLPDGLVRQPAAALLQRRPAGGAAAAAALLLLNGCEHGVDGCRGAQRLAPPVLLLLLAVLGQAEHGAHDQLILRGLSAQHGQVEQVVCQRLIVQACGVWGGGGGGFGGSRR